jgi:hypothetical protein
LGRSRPNIFSFSFSFGAGPDPTKHLGEAITGPAQVRDELIAEREQ